MKKLLFLSIGISLSLGAFNLPFQINSEKIEEVKKYLTASKNEMNKEITRNLVIAVTCGASAKAALIGSIILARKGCTTDALMCAALTGALEVGVALSYFKMGATSNTQGIITLGETIINSVQNALPNDKNQQ